MEEIVSFWWIKQYIEEKGYSVGHSLLSFGHIAWLIFITLAIIFIIKYYNNVDKEEQSLIKKYLALVIFILEYVKIIIVGFLFPKYINMYVPLHLCSFAGISIIFEACFGKNKTLDQMWLYVFLPSGLIGLLSPSVSVPFFNFFTFHTYIFHGILVLYAFIKIIPEKVEPLYIGLLKSTFITMCIGIPIYFINKGFGTNFFIISEPSDFPIARVFWNFLTPRFGEFGYAIGVFLFSFLIFNIIYLILFFAKHLKKK